jgi:hypothetical protein
MCVSRERLRDIVELAEESEMRWAEKPRTSSLAFWLRDVAKAVIALAEGQEQHEAEIVALGEAVDQIDARIDGIDGEVPDELRLDCGADFEPLSGHGVVNLTTVPYVVDHDLWLNEARLVGDKLHVGALFADMLEGAAKATKQFNVGDRVYLARPDPQHGRYCIPDVAWFEYGTVISELDAWGDYTVRFERINSVHAVKPTMIDPAKAAA